MTSSTLFGLLVFFLCIFVKASHALNKTLLNIEFYREQTLEMFHHAFWSYMKFAYPADELMPISCKGRFRGVTPSRGDIDDALGNFSLTLIDTLDTLVVLGDYEEFEMAVKLILSEVQFDSDLAVSVFETNIRVVGGLLSGHLMAEILKVEIDGFLPWYDNQLLNLAKQVADRLLPAFDTKTGVPYPRVNLKYGLDGPAQYLRNQQDTCTACAGTMILEFAALSRLTFDPIYETKARKAMDFLWKQRHSVTDLMGTVLNVQNGDWIRRDSGVGAGIDSYYEYCLKAYILLGDEAYLHRFNKHYEAVMKYNSQGPTMIDVQMHNPTVSSRTFMDALLAFWPGLQVLKGDIKSAVEMHEILYQVIQKHNFLPEAFTHDFQVHWGQHPLRPEFVESTYFLYKATKDEHYLKIGEEILNTLNKHVRVDCGFAGVKDVRTMTHEDRMDSFVLAETFKYLYLLFAERDDLLFDVDNFIFTTEAHFLPLSVSSFESYPKPKFHGVFRHHVVSSFDDESEVEEDRVCANANFLYQTTNGGASYVSTIRDRLKNWVHKSSIQSSPQLNVESDPNLMLLNPAEFNPSNSDHIFKLKRMGITISTESDGKLQLVHTSNHAHSAHLAAQGVKFMQIMLSLVGDQNSHEGPILFRVLQILSTPFFGRLSHAASAAQFGKNLNDLPDGISGELMESDPSNGCTAFSAPKFFRQKIALIERGGCMFVEKVRNAQKAGAVGAVIIDHANATDAVKSSMFAMSGDGSSDVTIPSIFLSSAKGKKIVEILRTKKKLVVRLAEKTRNAGEIFNLWLKGAYRTTVFDDVQNVDHSVSNLNKINDFLAKSSADLQDQKVVSKSQSTLISDSQQKVSRKTENNEISKNSFDFALKSAEISAAHISVDSTPKINAEVFQSAVYDLKKLKEFLSIIENKLKLLKNSSRQDL